MQCHNITDWPTQSKVMCKWKDEGKFRYIGVTHHQDHAHDELERILKSDKPDFVQTNYSIAEPEAAERLLPTAKDVGVAVLINRPFEAGGLFNHSATNRCRISSNRLRKRGQAFLKFVIANDAVTSVIARHEQARSHARDNLEAGWASCPSGDEQEAHRARGRRVFETPPRTSNALAASRSLRPSSAARSPISP